MTVIKKNEFNTTKPHERWKHVYNDMSEIVDRMRSMIHAHGCKRDGCPQMCVCYRKRSKPLDLHTALFWNSISSWTDLLDHCREVFYWWQDIKAGKVTVRQWDANWIWQCLSRPYGSDKNKWEYILKRWKTHNRIVNNALGLHKGKYMSMLNQFKDMDHYLQYAILYLKNGSSGSVYSPECQMVQSAGRIKRRQNLGGKQKQIRYDRRGSRL